MLQVVQNNRSGKISVVEVPAPTVTPGQVLVQNSHSLVSAGTEKAGLDFARSSLIGKARARPDLVSQVLKQVKQNGISDTYRKVRERLDEPQPLGYSCAGKVIAVGDGVTGITPGMNVAGAGVGYASHAEYVSVPQNLVVPVPSGVVTESASFATLGAIALQGIRRAELTPGESVGVIGLGLIGQITVQLLKAYGFPVLGLDISKSRIDEASAQGMDAGAIVGTDDCAAIAQSFSGGYGLDAAIITAASNDSSPVELAGEIVREHGRVSAVGDVGMEIPRRVYYPKEIDFRISRSYGPGRYDTSYEENGLDYPLPWVRWTEQRNMQEFLRLVEAGSVRPEKLVTHSFKIADAEQAYTLVGTNPKHESFLAVLVEYPTQSESPIQTIVLPTAKTIKPSGSLRCGLIGAGNFMAGTIVPAITKIVDAQITTVASARGLSAKNLATKVGAQTATSDYKTLLDDENIDLIVSATRHDLAAQISIESLEKGKAIHVEKPLALTLDNLRLVAAANENSDAILNVGFNRRFAPLVSKISDHFSDRTTPLSMTYRVNAGWIDADHWVHDPLIGGGRIIGEVCHFVDLLQHICNSKPTQVYATRLPENGKSILHDDNVMVVINFEDGSRGSITYSALGASGQPKERLEVLGSGKSAELDDYRSLVMWSGSKRIKHSGKADKGHRQMFQQLADSVQSGAAAPIPFDQIAASSLATLAIVKSMDTGQPVDVDTATLQLSVQNISGTAE
jgi:predicted dehydrogenase/threonine dehydrogenase-like Zn-dependent dehydrogenase